MEQGAPSGSSDDVWEETMLWLQNLEEEKTLTEALPVVTRVHFSYGDKPNDDKSWATLSCCWAAARRSFKTVAVSCDEKDKPTHLEALRELRKKILDEHCREDHTHDPRAVEQCKRAQGQEQEAPQSFFERSRLAQAVQVSCARKVEADTKAFALAERAEREAVAAREAAATVLRESKAMADAVLGAKSTSKRQKRDTPRGALSEEGLEAADEPHWSAWTLSTWRKLETELQHRRSIEIGEDMDECYPPRGDETRGWRLHWRRGLYGALKDWAEGSKFRVGFMLSELVLHFGVVELVCSLPPPLPPALMHMSSLPLLSTPPPPRSQVGERLGIGLSKEEVALAKTDKYIVDRLKAALGQLKQCRSEEERCDYHTVLAAVAPTREAVGEKEGMINKVSERLGVEQGARYVKKTGEKRPYVFDQAITQRGAFDQAALLVGRLEPGDRATSRGQPCTIIAIDYEADTCTLSFSLRGIEAVRTYSHIYKGVDPPKKAPFPQGSARLRRVPPSLRPKPRETRRDEVAEAARPKVEELYDMEGARSPAQRDRVRRFLGVGLHESAQALIVYAKQSALYALYCVRYPAHKIAYSTFKKLRPWFARRAKESTCNCKHCDNYKQYQATLHSLVQILEPLLDVSPTTEADDNGDRESPNGPSYINDIEESETASWEGRAALERLLKFCALKFKSEMVKFALCPGAFDGPGKQLCIDGSCPSCGFSRIWSKGLRPHVVDDNNNVRSTAPVEFETEVKWVRIRSSKVATPGESSASSYESKRGTIVQFLDEFESDVMRKYPHHRFTIQRQKAMDAEFQRNRWPGWLQFDVDFAMNGTIPPPQGRSMQADHWSPMDYTLFINITSWLRTDKWVSRTSKLAKGDAVTVEHANTPMCHATEPATGSYWAEVVSLPTAASGSEPERCIYGVRRHNAASDAPLEMVERRFLRHRVLHTKAFIHVSDDKTHDSNAAQVFINTTLEFLEEQYVKTCKEQFIGLRMHSDNAPSHFKSSKTMYYLTTLPERLKSWASVVGRSFRIVWEFGAPGHGKGVWDGIGAWMKRTVRQDVVDHRESMPTVLTCDGKILSPRQVAEHLKVMPDSVVSCCI